MIFVPISDLVGAVGAVMGTNSLGEASSFVGSLNGLGIVVSTKFLWISHCTFLTMTSTSEIHSSKLMSLLANLLNNSNTSGG